MDTFEYFAYDRTNNFAVVIKQFETLVAAQKYKLENIAAHCNQTIRFVLQPPAAPQPEKNADV